jgi:hypothetical protein
VKELTARLNELVSDASDPFSGLVRHRRQSRWLDECERLKDGRTIRLSHAKDNVVAAGQLRQD